jgi:uncharacterized protein YbjT (DUF2867 family)
MRRVLLAGSTGLIGRAVLGQLAGRADVQVTALVRRPSGRALAANVAERVFTFAPPGDYRLIGTAELPCDVLLCCVGSTMRQAGSQEAFRQVERDVPLALAARLAASGPEAVFGFVSSIGAERPTGFYLKNKAETEAGIVALGVRHVIVRPSLLLGERQELRPGERLATWVMPPLFTALGALGLTRVAAVAKYRPIPATRVAATLIAYCVDQPARASRVVEGREFL